DEDMDVAEAVVVVGALAAEVAEAEEAVAVEVVAEEAVAVGDVAEAAVVEADEEAEVAGEEV
ncbi:unnamed protein product, partial [Pseudo-nitzschia multistriata]